MSGTTGAPTVDTSSVVTVKDVRVRSSGSLPCISLGTLDFDADDLSRDTRSPAQVLLYRPLTSWTSPPVPPS